MTDQPPGPSPASPGGDSFLGNLGLALGCWRTDPRLPLLSLALVVAAFLPSLLMSVSPAFSLISLLILPISIFSIGFYGTQRIWYLRLFRGGSISPAEVWSISWRMLGRYLELGLYTGWPLVLLTVIWSVSLVARWFSTYQPGHRAQPATLKLDAFLAVVIIGTLIWDFLLTFATPALAYTTSNSREAFRIMIRMIRQTWPAAALYVFFPPLALQFLSQVPRAVGIRALPVIYVAGVVTAILNLAAKGAVAAFYMRRLRVPDDGSLNQ